MELGVAEANLICTRDLTSCDNAMNPGATMLTFSVFLFSLAFSFFGLSLFPSNITNDATITATSTQGT
jgi:hypothetical protein